MKPIVADAALVASCGLYCGACGRHRRGSCPGCRENVRASWCKIRSCCIEHGYATCADCTTHANPRECRHFSHPIARVLGFILRSDRAACIRRIREVGGEAFAAEMAETGRQSLPRGGSSRR